MKILYLLICLLTLSVACKKDTEGGPVKEIGTIEKQGFTTYQYGTHILLDRNGKLLYALRSKKVNLNIYLDKFVEIEGYSVKGYSMEGGPIYLEVAEVEEY